MDSGKIQHKIRLYGVDCPEGGQDFTSDLIFGKTVSVKVMDTDRYGRTVGVVNIGSKSLNEEIVKVILPKIGKTCPTGYHIDGASGYSKQN